MLKSKKWKALALGLTALAVTGALFGCGSEKAAKQKNVKIGIVQLVDACNLQTTLLESEQPIFLRSEVIEAHIRSGRFAS